MSLHDTLVRVRAAFFVVATLYTTVGHAGASGYLATMALVGLAPEVMRPTALVLNILVAAVTGAIASARRATFPGPACGRSWLARYRSLPLAESRACPAARTYVAMGVVLLLAATYLGWHAFGSRPLAEEGVVKVRKVPAVLMGAALGFLSGLIGVGGGIFLSPILLILGWSGPKTTAGISAPFILVNSTVALIAGSLTVQSLPAALPALVVAALAGALLGTWLGLKRLKQKGLLLTLAFVMSLAGVKLLLTA